MAQNSHNQVSNKSPEMGPLLQEWSNQEDLFQSFGNCSEFARKLLNHLPIEPKVWASDLTFSDKYIRQMRNGERPISKETAEEIVRLADIYTTVHLRWKLEVDMYRQYRGRKA